MRANVAVKPKCYVYQCLVCGALDLAERSDRATYSTACRVQAHRTGKLKRMRDAEKSGFGMTPGRYARASAIRVLRPDLIALIDRGELAEDGPKVMGAVFDEFKSRLWGQLEGKG